MLCRRSAPAGNFSRNTVSDAIRMRRLPIAALALTCAATAACGGRVEEVPDLPDERAAAVLWLPSPVTIRESVSVPVLVKDGRSFYADGSASLSFTATIDREQFASSLVQHFATTEWQQRRTQYLNPQMATSFDRGWEGHCSCVLQRDADGNVLPPRHYYEWIGEWHNPRGDVVHYSLGAIDEQIHGFASYIPRRIAARSVP